MSLADKTGDALHCMLRQEVDLVLSQHDCFASAAATQDAVSKLKFDLETTIARALRDRNRNARTLASRIPTEIWLYAWKWLSFADMVSVARVCHDWRTIAHSCSALWTSVDVFCDIHHDECNEGCKDCEQASPRPCETNVGQAFFALRDLSKCKPVSLVITSRNMFTPEQSSKQLQRCVELCAPRLVDLEVVYDDTQLLNDLLVGKGNTFPMLRRLKMRHAYGSDSRPDEDDPGYFVGSHVLFPVLEVLDAGPPLSWPTPDQTTLHLPSLRKLTFTFWTRESLRAALLACPATCLRSLDFHWRLSKYSPRICDVDATTLHLLDQVPIARVSNLPASQEEKALAVFTRQRRQLLQLSYSGAKIALGLRACRNLDLSAGVELRCSLRDGIVTLAIVDRSLDTVEFVFALPPRFCASINWDVLPDGLTSLSVDATAWTPVLHGLPRSPKVREITLRISDAASLDTVHRRANTAWAFAPDVSLRVQSVVRSHALQVIVSSASVEYVRSLFNARTVIYDGVAVRN